MAVQLSNCSILKHIETNNNIYQAYLVAVSAVAVTELAATSTSDHYAWYFAEAGASEANVD